MDRVTARKLVRRVAFTLILVLQLTHSYIQIAYKWTPPQKSNPKLTTMATLIQLVFISICCFSVTEHDVNVKLGKHLVRGLGIEILLWAIVVWSAALAGMDIWHTPDGLMGTMQLLTYDIIMFMDMFGAARLIDNKECRDQSAPNEKTDKMEA